MILATLGTHPQPMDRVVRALDDLVERGAIHEPVFIQAARFSARPVHCEALEVIAYADLLALMRRARLVITHAGPGSVMTALAVGRIPIVIPRDPAHGEHVDPHQLAFADWLAARRNVTVVRNISELEGAIARAAGQATAARPVGPSPEVVERLAGIIEPRAG